ncbi:MAG: PAS domain S-box protein [Thermoplasmata archaeon]|nr:PAS domain S-box protein [Thermoplasmata archaeon]
MKKFRLKIRGKFLLLFLVISLIPLVILSEFVIQKTADEVKGEAESNLKNLIELKADYYNEQLNSLHKKVELLSMTISAIWNENGEYNASLIKNYTWIAPDNKNVTEHITELKNAPKLVLFLKNLASNDKRLSLAYFGTTTGVLFVSDSNAIKSLEKEYEINGTPYDPRVRPWYTTAVKAQNTAWSKFYVDANTHQLVTTVSTPVYVNNEFIGVAALDLLLVTMQKDIKEITYDGEGCSLILNSTQHVIIHPEKLYGKSWKTLFGDDINVTISSILGNDYEKILKNGFGTASIDGTKYYVVSHAIGEINGTLVFLLPEEIVLSPMEEIKEMVFVAFIFSSIAVIAIAIVFSSSIAEPIRKLNEATKKVAAGDLDYKVESSTTDEIGELADNFNEMVKKLKDAQRKLIESEKRYREIFDISQDVIYVSTPDGKLVDINKAGEKLFGYSKEELLKINTASLYADREDREKFKEAIRKSKDGTVSNFEVKLRRKDGKIVDCLLSTVLIKKNGKDYYTGIIKDITALKAADKKLEMYNTMLRHDIANRLQIAMASIELAKEEEDKKEIKSLIDRAFNNLLGMRDLLLKLRMLSKIGKEISVKGVDLDEAIKRSISELESEAKQHGIKIKYKDIGKAVVLADDMLPNIISNLIENAIKHSGCKNIWISVKDEGDEYVVRVRDDGKGIPEDIKNKVFEMGVKGGESKGSGLGLHLVKNIIEGYGGSIKMESGKEGTCFEIHLRKHHL